MAALSRCLLSLLCVTESLGYVGLGRSLYDPVLHIESARLYGNIDDYAYYFVDLIVGTPPQRVSVILDTGSSVCAFPCAGCAHCGSHIDPLFDIGQSSTASWLTCSECGAYSCRGDKCQYHQGYTEGSSITGYWFKDMVRLGDTIQHNPAVLGKMGCHSDENNLFYTQKANGIFGVAPDAGGNTLLHTLFQDNTHVQAEIFSICLAEWGGMMTVGGFNSSYHLSDIVYIPQIPGRGFYTVSLSEMRIAGNPVASDFRSTMIDSGTTYTYMGSGPYRGLREGVMSYCQSHANCGASNNGNCFNVDSNGPNEGLAGFPDIEVVFGNAVVLWVAKAYLWRKGGGNTWCFGFEDDGPGAGTVLGASWMMHKDIIFDQPGQRVGIAQANCPEFRERPSHDRDADLAVPTVPPPGSEVEITTPAAEREPATTPFAQSEMETETETQPEPQTWTAATSLPPNPTRPSGEDKNVVPPTIAPPSEDRPGNVTAEPAFLEKEVFGFPMKQVLVAGVSFVLVVWVGGCCLYRHHRKRLLESRHVQLPERKVPNGMPPNIVGAEGTSPGGPDTFVIGDEDEDDEGFVNSIHGVQAGTYGNARHTAEATFGDGSPGPPVFSGGARWDRPKDLNGPLD